MLQTYNNGSKLSEANTFQMDQASIRFGYYVIITKYQYVIILYVLF